MFINQLRQNAIAAAQGRKMGTSLRRFAESHEAARVRPANFAQKIEIVVPCYNHAQFLPRALSSIRDQTWTQAPVAVTLIDDASTDETWRVITSFDWDQRFDVKHMRNAENLRQYGSLNRAIDASENDLIVVLNDDDALFPDALEKIVMAYEREERIFMLGWGSLWIDEAHPFRERESVALENLELTLYETEEVPRYRDLSDLNITHSSSSFFKVAWAAAGGYRKKGNRIHPDAPEDRDFQMRVNALHPVGVYRDYPLALWRSDSTHGHEY